MKTFDEDKLLRVIFIFLSIIVFLSIIFSIKEGINISDKSFLHVYPSPNFTSVPTKICHEVIIGRSLYKNCQ